MDESILEGLKDINGYLGSAISNYTGEILIADTHKVAGSLEEASLTFNEAFRSLQSISKKLNLGDTQVMEVEMDKAVVIMVSSGEDLRLHLHAFAIFKKDGSVALGKLELKKIVEKAVKLKGIKCVFLQEGVTNEKSKEIAKNAGVFYVEDKCIMVEHKRCESEGLV